MHSDQSPTETLLHRAIELTRTRSDRFDPYERVCLLELSRLGATSIADAGNRHGDDKLKFWIPESLIFCIRELREGAPNVAIRGLFQALAYNGQENRAFWPIGLSDTVSFLKGEFESLLMVRR